MLRWCWWAAGNGVGGGSGDTSCRRSSSTEKTGESTSKSSAGSRAQFPSRRAGRRLEGPQQLAHEPRPRGGLAPVSGTWPFFWGRLTDEWRRQKEEEADNWDREEEDGANSVVEREGREGCF